MVLEVAPPWLQPAVRGQQGPGSCQLALPWPCLVAWCTWAPCVLLVNGMCCPRLLHFPSWGWDWAGGPSVAACGDSLCSNPELGQWGSAALLTPSSHLCPSAALSGLILHPCVSQPPGTLPTAKNLRGAAQRGLSCEQDASGALHRSVGCKMQL